MTMQQHRPSMIVEPPGRQYRPSLLSALKWAAINHALGYAAALLAVAVVCPPAPAGGCGYSSSYSYGYSYYQPYAPAYYAPPVYNNVYKNYTVFETVPVYAVGVYAG